MFAALVASTRCMKKGEAFIDADETCFMILLMDADVAGGCSNCSVSCPYAFARLPRFGESALMCKPMFENMLKVFTTDTNRVNTKSMW